MVLDLIEAEVKSPKLRRDGRFGIMGKTDRMHDEHLNSPIRHGGYLHEATIRGNKLIPPEPSTPSCVAQPFTRAISYLLNPITVAIYQHWHSRNTRKKENQQSEGAAPSLV